MQKYNPRCHGRPSQKISLNRQQNYEDLHSGCRKDFFDFQGSGARGIYRRTPFACTEDRTGDPWQRPDTLNHTEHTGCAWTYWSTTKTRGRRVFRFPRLQIKGPDVLAFTMRGRKVIRTLAAAGDVAVVGCRRWWMDVWVICRRGVVQCWDLHSSITCFAHCLSFFSQS